VQIKAVKKYEQKNSATSGRLIKAVNVSHVYVCIFCTIGQFGWSTIPYLLE